LAWIIQNALHWLISKYQGLKNIKKNVYLIFTLQAFTYSDNSALDKKNNFQVLQLIYLIKKTRRDGKSKKITWLASKRQFQTVKSLPFLGEVEKRCNSQLKRAVPYTL
jgi:hypothetical protein